MFDRGTGPPLVVIPGVQGRWEWMRPTLAVLQRTHRTISYTLRGDPGSGAAFDPSAGFANYTGQLDAIIESCGLDRPALCGVSYGGFIALRYAATYPDRVGALILVSSPAPGWVPSPRQRAYVRTPWRSAPAFVASAPLRLWPEIRSACPHWRARAAFAAVHAARVLAAPAIPSRMAGRVRLQQDLDFAPDCRRITVPTLVITGEAGLDQVVPVADSCRYVDLIPGASHTTMTGTGHLGMLTQPGRFAAIVDDFLEAASHAPSPITQDTRADHH